MRLALVNNMPEAAFHDTESQFRRVLALAAGDEPELALYALPGLERTEELTREIAARYRPLDELWSSAPDGVIITGTEPSQSSLQYEPYWPYLAHLLQWAADTVGATLLSCLASHASVLLFDGLERVPLASKRHGVFACTVPDPADPLSHGVPADARMPHSRINDVPAVAMLAAGYRIVATDEDESWSVAVRRQGAGTFVLCQGHPEYSPDSLLREYRRDVRRAVLGRGMVAYPPVPSGYLDASAVGALEAFAATEGSSAEVMERFPYDAAHAGIEASWEPTSVALFRNWLALAGER